MIRKILLLAALLAEGCSTQPPVLDPTGRADSSGRYVTVRVNNAWKLELWETTRKLVTDKLAFPATAEFNEAMQYDADYDKIRRVTELKIYSNADSEGPYAEVVHQGFYVAWEKPGDLRQTGAGAAGQWQVVDVEILEKPFDLGK